MAKKTKNKKQNSTSIQNEQVFENSKLISMLQNEYICLTEGITYFGNPKGKKDYFIYWTMQGKKALFETGNIVLVDDSGTEDYFRQAFERKYKTTIPKTKYYDTLIKNQVKKYRDKT